MEVSKRDLDLFTSALRTYAKHRRMDNADALNRAGMQLAYTAINQTRTANAQEVEQQLRRTVASRITNDSGRRLKKPRPIQEATTYGKVAMIIKMRAGQLFYKGFPNATDPRQYSRDELNKLALRYVNRRIASVGFIASGWIPAYRKFRATYKGSKAGMSLAGKRQTPGLGGAEIAQAVENAAAVLFNKSTTPAKGADSALHRVGTAGLNRALSFVRQDMLAFVKKQLAERAARFNRA
jgi:hypothetical protein